MGKDRNTSLWHLKDEGCDNFVYPRYSLWTWRMGMIETKLPMPIRMSHIVQVGYDEDYKLRSYSEGSHLCHGWLYVKLLDPKDRYERWYGKI
jgi:hypothetical protein